MQAFIKKIVWCLVGCSMAISISVSANTLAIPNVPLQTGSDVPANIMFLIDDSGSMRWGFMPDELVERIPKWNNRARDFFTDCQSMGNYAGVNNTCFMADTSLRYLASSHLNTVYYDPTKNYTPPMNANGSLHANASFSNARLDGYNQNSITINLRTNYRAIMDDYYYRGWWGGRWRAGFTVSENGAASRAFYYRYSATRPGCNNPYADACYEKVFVTAAEETNFANWFSYYRTRLLSARYGIGVAFNSLPDDIRIGYGALNTTPRIQRGVREFSGTGRSQFYTWLYGKTASGGTPLRNTLKAAGEYFKTDEPYRVNPAVNGSPLISCRQNFTILMTDGAWNGDSPGIGDSDKDGISNTLADVAHHYYINDLSSLPNNVPRRKTSSPNWQHMVTFGVGLGVDGTLDPAVAANWAPNDSRWPDPFSGNDTSLKKIDDLLHASVNSDGGFFSTKDPQTFSKQLAETLKGILDRVASASNLAATTTSLQEENSVFQASFGTANWSGTLRSRDPKTLAEQWSANFAPWQNRPIYSSRTVAGNTSTFLFNWDNLNASERTALESQTIVNYIRGERSNEKPDGALRRRISVLADIAHSSPVYVGAPQNRNYQRYNWDGASTYAQFINAQRNRAPVVYVGANGGMLHAFNANLASSEKGKEIFAYMPQRMLTASGQLASFAKETYSHRFYVDGSPTVSDVYINNQWRSVLVTTLGRGGNSVFALDVTNPANITLLWDITLPELGLMTAKPLITRLNNNRWAAVMPYGYNNSANKNGLLVIDIQNADVSKLELPSSAGALGQPEGWDLDRNGNTDLFFAGDLNGNVWKFNLQASSPASWGLANGNTPLFTARAANNKIQPITGGITLSSHPKTGELWLFFGTGKYLETGDSLNGDQQSWYGITDGAAISSRAQLVQRTISNVSYSNGSITEQARSVSAANANDMDGKRGWYMDLIDVRERITSKPRMSGNNLLMNTIIPDSDLCNPEGDGWIMAVDPFSGGRLKQHFFDLSKDGEFNDSDGLGSDGKTVASGLKVVGMPSEPVIIGEQIVIGDSRGEANVRGVNLQLRRGRMSWREVVN